MQEILFFQANTKNYPNTRQVIASEYKNLAGLQEHVKNDGVFLDGLLSDKRFVPLHQNLSFWRMLWIVFACCLCDENVELIAL